MNRRSFINRSLLAGFGAMLLTPNVAKTLAIKKNAPKDQVKVIGNLIEFNADWQVKISEHLVFKSDQCSDYYFSHQSHRCRYSIDKNTEIKKIPVNSIDKVRLIEGEARIIDSGFILDTKTCFRLVDNQELTTLKLNTIHGKSLVFDAYMTSLSVTVGSGQFAEKDLEFVITGAIQLM